MSPNHTKTRIPQQERGIATKARIQAAAKDLFSAKGFHGTNAKEIASAAGVSVGSFYAYYENKKALFMDVFWQHIDEQIMAIIDNHQIETSREKETVNQIIQAIAAAHDLSPDFHREAMAMCYSDPEIEALHARVKEKSLSHFTETLFQHRDRLRVADIEAAAAVVCSSVEEVIHSFQYFKAPIEKERLIAALSDMISRFLFK